MFLCVMFLCVVVSLFLRNLFLHNCGVSRQSANQTWLHSVLFLCACGQCGTSRCGCQWVWAFFVTNRESQHPWRLPRCLNLGIFEALCAYTLLLHFACFIFESRSSHFVSALCSATCQVPAWRALRAPERACLSDRKTPVTGTWNQNLQNLQTFQRTSFTSSLSVPSSCLFSQKTDGIAVLPAACSEINRLQACQARASARIRISSDVWKEKSIVFFSFIFSIVYLFVHFLHFVFVYVLPISGHLLHGCDLSGKHSP